MEHLLAVLQLLTFDAAALSVVSLQLTPQWTAPDKEGDQKLESSLGSIRL